MDSKYVGKVFEGYEVVNYFVKNKYKTQYKNDLKDKDHRAYSYTLVNYDKRDSIVLSGNQLRRLNNGETTINEMFNGSSLGGYKNKKIGNYKKGK